MLWSAVSFGLDFLARENQASAQRAIAGANYNLDRAQESLSNTLSTYQANKSYSRELQITNGRLDEISATNDAIIDANRKNTAAAHYKAGLLQMQVGLARKTQSAERTAMRETTAQALGSVTANAAAAGTIGSSVDAVALDVQRQLGEGLVRKDEDWDIQAKNFQTQMYDLYAGLANQLQSGIRTANILDPELDMVIHRDAVQKQLVPDTMDVLVGSLGNTISNYAQQRIQLGLGQ